MSLIMILKLIVTICIADNTAAVNILMVPLNVRSHTIYYEQLAIGLKEEGHNVTILTASNAQISESVSVTALRYQADSDVPYGNTPYASKLITKSAFTDSILEKARIRNKLYSYYAEEWNRNCKQMMRDKKLNSTVLSANYDFVILNGLGFDCPVISPYTLKIPYAIYTVPFYPLFYRIPTLPSFVPDLMTPFSDKMSFTERVMNTCIGVINALLFEITLPSEEMILRGRVISNKDVIMGASLWLLMRDVAMYYPSPNMPNTVNVGDVMAVPAKPLTEIFLQIVNETNDGIIIVSFGSMIDFIPEEIFSKLCDAFSRVPQTVIWKLYKKPSQQLSRNVKVFKWISQNDLLGQPNVQLLITHAGFSSMIEAINHAVPMIAIPIFLDQFNNAGFVVNRGMGIKMDIKSFSADELAHNIGTVINDTSYKEAVAHHSGILNDKLETPARRSSFWISHIIKYGDNHLRTSAYDLNMLQFLMVDIFVSLACIAFVFLSIATVFLIYLYRVYTRMHKNISKAKTD